MTVPLDLRTALEQAVVESFTTVDSATPKHPHSLTRHTARAWGHKNVRCNAVAPGKVLSGKGMTTTPQGYNQSMLDRMCLPRLGQPQDLASTLAFLLSDESSWITGQILSVDGGLMLRE